MLLNPPTRNNFKNLYINSLESPGDTKTVKAVRQKGQLLTTLENVQSTKPMEVDVQVNKVQKDYRDWGKQPCPRGLSAPHKVPHLSYFKCSAAYVQLTATSTEASLRTQWRCTHQALGAHSTSRAMWQGAELLSLPEKLSRQALATNWAGSEKHGKDTRRRQPAKSKMGEVQSEKCPPHIIKKWGERLGAGCNTARHLFAPWSLQKLDEAIKNGWTMDVYSIRNYC